MPFLEQLEQLFQIYPRLLPIFTLLLGLIIGSFLNVVIYRLPLMMDQDWRGQCREFLSNELKDIESSREESPFTLSRPHSHCPKCKHPISALENIPLFSYLIQRGRCRHCDHPIGIRYPLVELLTGILSVVVVIQLGFTMQAAAALLLTWSLITLSFIDYDWQLLPDSITLPLLWFGLLLNMIPLWVDLETALLGTVIGYLSLWSVYQLFKLVTGKEGMGFGDFKLLALFGAWLGWQHLPLIIILSAAAGAVIGILLIVFRGHQRDKPIPFGPYLAIAGWIALLWGDPIISAYLNWALST